jgi:hypothetical protein
VISTNFIVCSINFGYTNDLSARIPSAPTSFLNFSRSSKSLTESVSAVRYRNSHLKPLDPLSKKCRAIFKFDPNVVFKNPKGQLIAIHGSNLSPVSPLPSPSLKEKNELWRFKEHSRKHHCTFPSSLQEVSTDVRSPSSTTWNPLSEKLRMVLFLQFPGYANFASRPQLQRNGIKSTSSIARRLRIGSRSYEQWAMGSKFDINARNCKWNV